MARQSSLRPRASAGHFVDALQGGGLLRRPMMTTLLVFYNYRSMRMQMHVLRQSP